MTLEIKTARIRKLTFFGASLQLDKSLKQRIYWILFLLSGDGRPGSSTWPHEKFFIFWWVIFKCPNHRTIVRKFLGTNSDESFENGHWENRFWDTGIILHFLSVFLSLYQVVDHVHFLTGILIYRWTGRYRYQFLSVTGWGWFFVRLTRWHRLLMRIFSISLCSRSTTDLLFKIL